MSAPDFEASLDEGRLAALVASHAEGFRTAAPFPHVVIDGFLDDDDARAVVAAFPAPSAPGWVHYHDYGRTEKLAMVDEATMPEPLRNLMWALNSGRVVRFLEQLTGIEGLVPDPHLVGGGLHRIEAGGFLDVHADFNRHAALSLERRLNLLLYLNPGWDESWGGELELWDRDAGCQRRVSPVMNRCVVFATTDDALHGHPEPLRCPPERARCSVALYYYTNGRPAAEQSAPHTTLYLGAEGEGPRRPGLATLARRVIRRA